MCVQAIFCSAGKAPQLTVQKTPCGEAALGSSTEEAHGWVVLGCGWPQSVELFYGLVCFFLTGSC
jgi:hypothetical protein